MLEWWNQLCLTVFDTLLGWLLAFPSDVVLLTVSIGTAAILVLARPLTTNQPLLKQVAADRRRLRELIREARKQRDKNAVRRYRSVRNMVSMHNITAEGKPLLVAIVPIAMLATWGFFRLEYHPPQVDEQVELAAYVPISAAGDAMHALPVEGLNSDRWIQPIDPRPDEQPPYGLATWTLSALEPIEQATIELDFRGERLEHPISVGQRTYADPLVFHDDELVTELRMRPLKLFGIVPGIPVLMLPPWIVAYLIVVIPFVFVLKWLLRIA